MISNDKLIGELKKHLGDERAALAKFLAYLGEAAERRVHAERGFPHMFAFCTQELGLKDGEAYLRLRAAGLMRRIPELGEMIGRGEVCLTAVRILAAHLEGDDAVGVLKRAVGKTTREVEKLAAEIEAAKRPVKIAPQPATLFDRPAVAAPKVEPTVPVVVAAPVAEPVRMVESVEPKVALKIEKALMDKLKEVMAVTGAGHVEEALAKALEDCLEKRDPRRKVLRAEKRKTAKNSKPEAKTKADGRYIPAAVKAVVYTRDDGRCTFVALDGRRCCEKRRLQYDHIKPFALGGSSTDPWNLRLLCQAHNRLMAERTYGKEKIEATIRAQQPQGWREARRNLPRR